MNEITELIIFWLLGFSAIFGVGLFWADGGFDRLSQYRYAKKTNQKNKSRRKRL